VRVSRHHTAIVPETTEGFEHPRSGCPLSEHRLLIESFRASPIALGIFDAGERLVVWNDAYEAHHAADIAHLRATVGAHAIYYQDMIRSHARRVLPPEAVEEDVRIRLASHRAANGEALDRRYPDFGWVRIVKCRIPSGGVATFAMEINELKEQQARLENARAAAVEAAQAKAAFLATMSHEIRTPMNGVLGMAAVLASTDLDERQRKFLDVIRKSAAALLTVINDVLDFSKIDAGQMTLDPHPFALDELVGDVAELIAPGLDETRVRLDTAIDASLPKRVVGDAGRLRQVLVNLAGNAAKFTEAGRISIRVGGIVRDATARLRFEVADTGCGVPAGALEMIFRHFQQVDGTGAAKGTGLGLAISRQLIDMMGGEIGVESREGDGSTFWFTVTLPVASDDRRRAPRR
jgi:signal transduction histidine kinase